MRYEKPEIMNLGAACNAVRGVKYSGGVFDGMLPPLSYKISAYEADE